MPLPPIFFLSILLIWNPCHTNFPFGHDTFTTFEMPRVSLLENFHLFVIPSICNHRSLSRGTFELIDSQAKRVQSQGILVSSWLYTGCSIANFYTSFCSTRLKYASYLDLVILSSRFFTYKHSIWLKVTSLSSIATVLRDGKFLLKFQIVFLFDKQIQKKFENKIIWQNIPLKKLENYPV